MQNSILSSSPRTKLLLVFLCVVIAGIIFLLWWKKKIQPSSFSGMSITPTPVVTVTILPSPEPTAPPVMTPRISAAPQKILYQSPAKDFDILYTDYNKLYTIIIYGESFETTRKKAEQQLLKLAGVSQKQACQLSVTVGEPYFVHKRDMPTYFSFSFCPSPTTAPR